MENIAYRLRRYFEKEITDLRDENVKFHQHINFKIETTLLEKGDFYDEIRDYVRFEELNVFTVNYFH